MPFKRGYALIFLLLLMASCSNGEKKRAFAELDDILARKTLIESEFDARLDSMRLSLQGMSGNSQRWEGAYSLFEAYLPYSLDSAVIYAEMLERLASNSSQQVASKCAKVKVLCAQRQYAEAESLLNGIDTVSLDDRELYNYYDAYQQFCASILNEHSLSDERREGYSNMRRTLFERTLGLSCLSEAQTLYTKARLMALDNRTSEAIESLKKACEICGDDVDIPIHSLYAIANAYNALGDRDRYETYLARSAMADISGHHKQYRSLYDLAIALWEDKEFGNAERYIQVALSDAIACNYGTRIVNTSESQHIINSGRNAAERQRFALMLTLIMLALATTFIVLYFLIKGERQKTRLRLLSEQLQESNEELNVQNEEIREQGIIREQYLFRYMTLSAGFVDNVDNYRHDLMQALKDGGQAALTRKLRNPGYSYMQYDSFYQLFDEVFLGIFPDFVDKVNELLPPESRFELRRDGSMPTELRVLAVIRLGMDKSGRIASFLNCSVHTVYAYRTKMRYASLCGADNFENEVKNIGITGNPA